MYINPACLALLHRLYSYVISSEMSLYFGKFGMFQSSHEVEVDNADDQELGSGGRNDAAEDCFDE